MGLEQIYSEILMEHNTSSPNKHHIDNPTAVYKGVNPSCGDEISLEIRVKDNKIEEAGFVGVGCAISQASTSIMIDLIKGKTQEEAIHLVNLFFAMIKKEASDEDLKELDEAIALQNISNMPARVKCAVLAWHTLESAIRENKKNNEN